MHSEIVSYSFILKTDHTTNMFQFITILEHKFVSLMLINNLRELDNVLLRISLQLYAMYSEKKN